MAKQINTFTLAGKDAQEVAGWCIENKIEAVFLEVPDGITTIMAHRGKWVQEYENKNRGNSAVFFIADDIDASAFKLRWC